MRTRSGLRRQLRRETVCGVIAVLLAGLTIVAPQWIESLLEVEPDAGSGSVEWLVAAGFGLAAVILAVLARTHRRALAAMTV